MTKRGVAVRVAVVGVVAAAGLAVAASPAAAMDRDCEAAATLSNNAARMMQAEGEWSYEAWNVAYSAWLVAERYLDRWC